MADGDFPRAVVTNLPAGHQVEVPPFAMAFIRRQMERLLGRMERLQALQGEQEATSNRLLALLERVKAEQEAAAQHPPKTEAKVIAISSARLARGSHFTQRKD